MNVPFENLGPESRIWIYQSSRKFSKEESKFILENTRRFLDAWTAHGNGLQAGVTIQYDQFIILGVNEAVSDASGCSIDKSVSFIRELEKALKITLLERSKVALKTETEIMLVDFSDIKKMVAEGTIQSSMEVFNNAIVKKEELEESWVKPAKKSWISKYLSQK